MSIWSAGDWPYFARKRIAHLNKYEKRSNEFNSVKYEIIKKIQENGYITSKDVNGNRKVDWSWAPTDIGRATLESMYHCGELVIHHKKGSRKYYGLTEKLLPRSILNKPDPNRTLTDFYAWYVKRRIGAIGLLWNKSGDAWLGSHLKKEERSQAIKRLLEKDEITEVKIAGVDELFYMQKKDLKILEDNEQRKEASVLAPLDNLLWDRNIIAKLFNFDYKWEVYTPVKDRKYGYYVVPVIYKERFIGRCEPILDRKTNGLLIQNWWWEKDVHMDQDMTDALIRCFRDFAQFLHVEKISISNTLSKKGLTWVTECG